MPKPDIVDVDTRVTPPIKISKPESKPKMTADLSPGDEVLRTRAIGLIFKARKKRDKDLIQQPRSREAAIDKAYSSALTVIRDAYVSRLKKAAAETSDAQLKPRLLAQAGRAKDLDAWIGLLSPEPKRIPKKNTDSFVGNWDKRSEGKITRWTARADGKLEVVGKDWDVKWKILGDGSLVIEWGKIRPDTLTRDGAGWTGKSTFGQPMSLSRGDW